MVENDLGHEPYTGDCFLFHCLGRERKKLKVLIWEDGGFWLCMKRLVSGTFAAVPRQPRSGQSPWGIVEFFDRAVGGSDARTGPCVD